MKHLYLLRHAKSSWANPALDDQDRPLNKRGKRQLSIMAPILLKEGALSAKIYASTAERAQQTIKGILAESTSVKFHESDKHLYTFNRKKLLKYLYKLPDDENEVLIVGHNPALEELITFLLKTPFDSLPTCSYVHLEIDTPSWSALSPLQAKVNRFITPGSACYKEFLRKTEKEEFKAKYKLKSDQAPIQETLLKLFVTSICLLPGCITGIDPEFMHQYRVNLRKARSIGNTVYSITKDENLNSLLSVLKEHGEITSELRDLDVFILYLKNLLQNSTEDFGSGLSLLLEHFQGCREDKLEIFKQSVESSTFHQERKALKKYLSSLEFANLCANINEDALNTRQKTIKDKLNQKITKLTADDADNDFHDLRKLIKKDRYLSEHLGQLSGKDKTLLKTQQEAFGRFQDLCTQCELLEVYLTSNQNKAQNEAVNSANLVLRKLRNDKSLQKQSICR